MRVNTLVLQVNAALIIASTLGLAACGPKASKTVISPTSFSGNVAKTSKDPGETAVVTNKPEEVVDEGNPDEGAQLALENKREKLASMQEKLRSAEERKNSLATQLNLVDVELAQVVVPTQNNVTAAIALYYGDYATAYAATARQKNAIAAAEKKKAQLTALAEQMKMDLATATEEAATLAKEVDVLAKEIDAKVAVTPAAE